MAPASSPLREPRDAVALALIQMRCGDDLDENLARACDRIEAAARDGAEMVALQELFRSRYPGQGEVASRFDQAEAIPGPTSETLSKLAAARGVVIVASLFEARTAGVYHNTAVVFDADGSQAGLYRKAHVPDDPLYQEKYYFTPGDTDFTAIPTRFGKLGPLVCWDQWFPEAARLCALAGAQLLVYPTAIGWQFDEGPEEDAAQHDAWETVQRAHAIANGVFVAAVNRVGQEGEIRFWGQSFVADPFGRVLARASADEEETLLVECDLRQIEKTRREWPFLRDRRIDAYGELARRLRDG
ncbi:MAG: carbon-nitrogen hydrolase [Myxococcota bacterium]|jgi:N-carbamoylputrescine amidase|nr:carbon-nitrogen hydrolase [Myxococcota bacterium]